MGALTSLQAADMSKKNFIKQAVPKSHKGDLHKALGVPEGKPIPQAMLAKAAKEPGKIGQMARLAETLEGFHKKQGR